MVRDVGREQVSSIGVASVRNGFTSEGQVAKPVAADNAPWVSGLALNIRKAIRAVGVTAVLLATVACISVFAPSATNAASKRKSPKPATVSTAAIRGEDGGPRIVTVSIRKQRLRLFDMNGEISTSRISSGRSGFDTPTGVFSIVQKKKSHVSNIYGASMPFMQRLTWSGIAMHAGQVPGYRASHGCIRLPSSFARSFYNQTSMGVRVIVTKDETRPVPFEHPKLFRPLPDANSPEAVAATRAAIGTQVASISATDGFDTQSTLQQLVNLPSYFWFTPALAEAMAGLPGEQQGPLTRQAAEQRIQDHVDRQLNEMKASEAALKKANKDLADLNASSRTTKTARRTLGKKLRTAQRNYRAALKRVADVTKAFSRYMATPLKQTQDAREAAVLREADLEDAILEATHVLDSAKREMSDIDAKMAKLNQKAAKFKIKENSIREAVSQAKGELKTAKASYDTAKREVARRRKPISIMVSLKSRKLFVRQGFEPVIEAPIELHGTPRRFGTHVYTAMAFAEDNPNAFEWRLVTAQAPALLEEGRKGRKSKRARRADLSERAQAEFAAAALDSFSIPEQVLDVIRELAQPGASMIVSDRALPPHENGKGVEFVVLTR